MKSQVQDSSKKAINQKLIDAAGSHNLEQVKSLLSQGANVNYIRYTNSDGWYGGDQHTALYDAVHNDFKGDEANYVNVLQVLLQNGANPNIYVRRGAWNHSTTYPLFSGVIYKLNKFKSEELKIKFIQIFVKHGININQSENHNRSKNWRAYNIHSCFIFQAMNSGGMPSKLRELAKLTQSVNIEEIRLKKQEELRCLFDKQNPPSLQILQIQKEQNDKKNARPPIGGQICKQQKIKKPEINFIKALINFGTNPDSSRSSSHWQNYSHGYGEDDYSKFEERISQEYQTILHRAIMNDQFQLVKLLIEKGAKIQSLCKLTIQVPVYSSEWPQTYITKTIKENEESMKSYQKTIDQYSQKLKSANEEDRKKYLRIIRNYQFYLFKSKRFSIQNQPPKPLDEVKKLSCLEIAQKLNVSEELLEYIYLSQIFKKICKQNPNIILAFLLHQYVQNCDQDLMREVIMIGQKGLSQN